MTRFLPSQKADCLTSAKKACLPYHCSLMVPKRKRALRPFLFATFRYCFFLSSAQRRMDALQANHDERPANPCGRAHPFSSVHPYGPPCESRAEAPGPSCLCSIAWNGGDNGEGNCGSVGLADRRLAVLAHYSPPKQCLKLFFFPLPCLLASRLLQWRLLRHAELQASTAPASTGAQRPMVNASMLTACLPPIVPSLSAPW